MNLKLVFETFLLGELNFAADGEENKPARLLLAVTLQ